MSLPLFLFYSSVFRICCFDSIQIYYTSNKHIIVNETNEFRKELQNNYIYKTNVSRSTHTKIQEKNEKLKPNKQKSRSSQKLKMHQQNATENSMYKTIVASFFVFLHFSLSLSFFYRFDHVSMLSFYFELLFIVLCDYFEWITIVLCFICEKKVYLSWFYYIYFVFVLFLLDLHQFRWANYCIHFIFTKSSRVNFEISVPMR